MLYSKVVVNETFEYTFTIWRKSVITMYGMLTVLRLLKECFYLLPEFFSKSAVTLSLSVCCFMNDSIYRPQVCGMCSYFQNCQTFSKQEKFCGNKKYVGL